MNDEWMKSVRETVDAMSAAFGGFSDVVGRVASGALVSFEIALAPYSLSLTDKHGHYLIRGKARRRLKLKLSQYRRGISGVGGIVETLPRTAL